MPRVPTSHNGKARGVGSQVNLATCMTEQLVVPTADTNLTRPKPTAKYRWHQRIADTQWLPYGLRR